MNRFVLLLLVLALVVGLVFMLQILGDHASNVATGITNPFDQAGIRLFPIAFAAVFSIFGLVLLWKALR